MRSAIFSKPHLFPVLTTTVGPSASSSVASLCALLHSLHSRCKTTLAYDEVVAHPPDKGNTGQLRLGLIVHGLLGTGRNWRTFARSIAKQAAAESGRGWRIILVDQRNHGHSAELAGFDPPHTLQAAAQDLHELIQQKYDSQQLSVMVGHSLGGKTTLAYLQQMAAMPTKSHLPQQVWILDSNIGKVTLNKDAPSDVDRVIMEIKGLQHPIASREWLYKFMEDQGYSLGLRLWMGSNLVPDGQGKLKWGFNIEGASDMYQSYQESSYWDLVQQPPKGTALHIVRAEKSDRWTRETMAQLQKAEHAAAVHASSGNGGRLHTHVLSNAGHWVHVDNPQGLTDMMLPSFVDADIG